MDSAIVQMLLEGIRDTMFMTVASTLFAYVLGFPIAIALVLFRKDGLKQNLIAYRIIDFITNILRSVPFLIMIILVIPLTRIIVGRSYGPEATVVPLVIAAAPFVARLIESSLTEVDAGVIEAALSMGATRREIVFKVMIPEAKTSLITGATIALTTILGYSAMAGAVGGGGLGDIAIRYGYMRYQWDIMIITVILLVILVQILQIIGTAIAKKTDKRDK